MESTEVADELVRPEPETLSYEPENFHGICKSFVVIAIRKKKERLRADLSEVERFKMFTGTYEPFAELFDHEVYL